MPLPSKFKGRTTPGRTRRSDAGYEMADVWLPAVPFAPHPDTEPGAVRAALDAAVRAARTRLGPDATPERVSEESVVPVWCVRRCLGGAEPPPPARRPTGRPPGRNGETAAAVRDYLTGKGRATVMEIVAGTGRCDFAVRSALSRRGDLFQLAGTAPSNSPNGNRKNLWGLVAGKDGAA